jgi:hypothetical protein
LFEIYSANIRRDEDDSLYYRGRMLKSEFHGLGELFEAKGDRYLGHFRQGKLAGHGCMILQDGHRYIGEYNRDKYHGRGLICIPLALPKVLRDKAPLPPPPYSASASPSSLLTKSSSTSRRAASSPQPTSPVVSLTTSSGVDISSQLSSTLLSTTAGPANPASITGAAVPIVSLISTSTVVDKTATTATTVQPSSKSRFPWLRKVALPIVQPVNIDGIDTSKIVTGVLVTSLSSPMSSVNSELPTALPTHALPSSVPTLPSSDSGRVSSSSSLVSSQPLTVTPAREVSKAAPSPPSVINLIDDDDEYVVAKPERKRSTRAAAKKPAAGPPKPAKKGRATKSVTAGIMGAPPIELPKPMTIKDKCDTNRSIFNERGKLAFAQLHHGMITNPPLLFLQEDPN